MMVMVRNLRKWKAWCCIDPGMLRLLRSKVDLDERLWGIREREKSGV